jgi:MoxR-like ATPase
MEANVAWQAVLAEVQKHIAGKTDVIELMFIALIANGHVLLEGMPGVAKTTMTKALSDAIEAEFKRVQGTPDITTGDIVGYTYIDDKTHEAVLKKGPIFSNIFLIDELNRMPQRTIAALLEALEERQVTIAGADGSIPLKKPFIAYATQNPISVEGTVTLPKVLADRFLMRVAVNYLSMAEEQQMLRLKESELKVVTNKVISLADILQMQQDVESIKIPDRVISYVTRIVDATRSDIHVVLGGSPRAEISFMRCGKARALIQGRKEVTIEDIKFLAKPVLSHRLVVRSTGGIGVNGIIDGITATLPDEI